MGNSVGSPGKEEKLSPKQKEVVIGCILGDGYLRKLEGRRDAFLEINHSIKAKEYVDWKWKILESIAASPPKSRRQNKGLWKEAYRFFTRQHPELTELWEKFYKNSKKIVPKGFTLTPLSLAVWFMDDGSRTKKGDVYLNCQQFDFESQRRLLHALRLLGIRARMNKDGKYYRIRIYKESLPKFFEIIKPYIHPSMQYKLPPEYKSSS